MPLRKYNHILKMTALVLCLCFAATVLVFVWHLISHAQHDCCGQGCAVCAQLAQNTDPLHKFAGGILFAALLALLFLSLFKRFSNAGEADRTIWHIRLNC